MWESRRRGIELSGLEAEVEWECGQKPKRIAHIDVVIRNAASQLGDRTRAFAGIAKGCTISKTLIIEPATSLTVE